MSVVKRESGLTLAFNMQKLQELADNSDELTPEMIADTLEGMEGELGDKLDAYMALSRNFGYQAESCKKEIERLNGRVKNFNSEADKWKGLVKSCLDTAGLTKLKTDGNTFTIRKGSIRVVIDDEKKIPDEFVDTCVMVAPKKAEIKAALESGQEVTGAHLETGEPSLQVR